MKPLNFFEVKTRDGGVIWLVPEKVTSRKINREGGVDVFIDGKEEPIGLVLSDPEPIMGWLRGVSNYNSKKVAELVATVCNAIVRS